MSTPQEDALSEWIKIRFNKLEIDLTHRITISAAEVKEDVNRIEAVLMGKMEIGGTTGIIPVISHHDKALYDKDNGLLHRVTKMEKAETLRKGWMLGAMFVCTATGGIIGAATAIVAIFHK